MKSSPRIVRHGAIYWLTVGGKLHRNGDLPAVIERDGYVEFWKKGKPHRSNGKPAVIHPNGAARYFEHDQEYYPG